MRDPLAATADATVDTTADARAPPALKPLQRLAQSRDRLRQAMRDVSAPPDRLGKQSAGGSAAAWLDSLKALPGASLVIEALSSWWARHPLRIAAMVGADAAKALVLPVAQRHPLGLMLGALLLGAALACSRPWRWMFKPALLAGLLPQLISKAMAQVPAQSWMAVLTSLAQERGKPAAQPAAQPPAR
jgi:hypothetical protein